jgi:hypothetical protein
LPVVTPLGPQLPADLGIDARAFSWQAPLFALTALGLPLVALAAGATVASLWLAARIRPPA